MYVSYYHVSLSLNCFLFVTKKDSFDGVVGIHYWLHFFSLILKKFILFLSLIHSFIRWTATQGDSSSSSSSSSSSFHMVTLIQNMCILCSKYIVTYIHVQSPKLHLPSPTDFTIMSVCMKRPGFLLILFFKWQKWCWTIVLRFSLNAMWGRGNWEYNSLHQSGMCFCTIHCHSQSVSHTCWVFGFFWVSYSSHVSSSF